MSSFVFHEMICGYARGAGEDVHDRCMHLRDLDRGVEEDGGKVGFE